MLTVVSSWLARSRRLRRRPAGRAHLAVLAAGAALAVAAALAAPLQAAAQIPYTVFDEDTEVDDLSFRFLRTRTFGNERLKQEIVLGGRGLLAGLRDALDFLPLISPPLPTPFNPVDLQRDVARLRRFYATAGFLNTAVSYEVQYDEESNRVDVTFVIDEGRPITLESLTIATPADQDVASSMPPELRPQWLRQIEAFESELGQRFNQSERLRHATDVLDWWRNHGWAFATVETEATIDTSRSVASLRVLIDPGPRARIGAIDIEGARSVSEDVIRRVLPFDTGDWFSAEAIRQAQQRIFALDLFRLALVDVERDSTDDALARVRIRVEEAEPRHLTGEVGYVSTGGIAGRGEFAHLNFLGGARTLRTNLIAETGVLGVGSFPERNYRLEFAFRQPYFFGPRTSLIVTPFAAYRNDLTDRSWQAGIGSSVIYQLGEFRYITVQHRLDTRRVLDYRLGSFSAIDLLTLIDLLGQGTLDTLTSQIDRSAFALSATIGRFDPTRPARALQVLPSIEITAPAALNTIEYVMLDLPIRGYLPLTERIAFAARASIGRLFPFGKTLRGDDVAGPLEAIQLRDVLLTAGGSGSVRGWGEDLLGPKFVDFEFDLVEGEDSVAVEPRGYAPAGGLARATTSLELRLPFPGLGPSWGTHVFLDAGRVWSPDERFQPNDPLDQRRWFFGTGAGFDLKTIVGPIRFSVGYKLNPSPLDVRDPIEVFQAQLEGRPLSTVPTSSWRRVHLHVTLGQQF